MATATTQNSADTAIRPPESAGGDQRVVMSGVDWEGYLTVLRLRGDRSGPRIIYLDGDLILMSPAYSHEWLKERLGSFIMVVGEEFDLPCFQAGGTTLRRREKKGGVEGDKMFYLSNAPVLLGKRKIDLETDPPPDLAIEVVNTHSADAAIEVYRRLGVPEVWIWEDSSLLILARQADGNYAETDRTSALPSLTRSEIVEWVGQPPTRYDTQWIRALRRWVREVLIPRARGQAPNEPPAGAV